MWAHPASMTGCLMPTVSRGGRSSEVSSSLIDQPRDQSLTHLGDRSGKRHVGQKCRMGVGRDEVPMMGVDSEARGEASPREAELAPVSRRADSRILPSACALVTSPSAYPSRASDRLSIPTGP